MEKAVTMYTLSTCSHCKDAKRFMRENGVDFEFTDVDLLETLDRAAIVQEIKKLNPSVSFPTILIGERVIVGFKENEIREALEHDRR